MQDHHNTSILSLQHTRAHGIHPSPGPERLACCLIASGTVSQQQSQLPLAPLTFWAQGRSGSISNQAVRWGFYTSHLQSIRLWGGASTPASPLLPHHPQLSRVGVDCHHQTHLCPLLCLKAPECALCPAAWKPPERTGCCNGSSYSWGHRTLGKHQRPTLPPPAGLHLACSPCWPFHYSLYRARG